jgi:hypothetical protein
VKPVYEVNVPEYTIDREPDHKAIGKIVDDVIKQHFANQTIVVRGLSSKEHPDKTLDQLIETIQQLGTDRYDPQKTGDRYGNIKGKHIDLFAFRRKVTPRMKLFQDISWGFYHGAKAIHGKPVRIDLLTIFDASQLKAMVHQYEGRDDIKRDGFVFRQPENKTDALLGIIKVN